MSAFRFPLSATIMRVQMEAGKVQAARSAHASPMHMHHAPHRQHRDDCDAQLHMAGKCDVAIHQECMQLAFVDQRRALPASSNNAHADCMCCCCDVRRAALLPVLADFPGMRMQAMNVWGGGGGEKPPPQIFCFLGVEKEGERPNSKRRGADE